MFHVYYNYGIIIVKVLSSKNGEFVMMKSKAELYPQHISSFIGIDIQPRIM